MCPNPLSPITIADPGTRYGNEGDIVSVPIIAIAPSGARRISYTATGLPTGLRINRSTGIISGNIVAGTARSYSVTVTVRGVDAKGVPIENCWQFTWKVSEATDWLVGDLFAGLADYSGYYHWWGRDGLWKGWVLSSLDDYSAGCASDWRTGDLFTTDFGYAPSTGARRLSAASPHEQLDFFDSDLPPLSHEYRDTVPEVGRARERPPHLHRACRRILRASGRSGHESPCPPMCRRC